MKPREKADATDPGQVGTETIALVEQELRALSFPISGRLLGRLAKFAAALALWGGATNLTAAPHDPAEVAFHILDSLAPLVLAARPEGRALGESFAPGRRILDLGSGAGFPGLVLAAATEARFTLLEARRKRASFLAVAATEMGLTSVEVDSRHRDPKALPREFEVVTGRAFAQPAIFYRSAANALKTDGIAVLYANPDQTLDQVSAAAAGFGESQQFPYTVPRANRRVPRLLVVARRL